MGKRKDTVETKEVILQARRMGLGIKDSCRVAGVTYQTCQNWRKEDGDFHEAVESEHAKLVKAVVGRIYQIALKSKDETVALRASMFIAKTQTEEYRERREYSLSGTVDDVAAAIREAVAGMEEATVTEEPQNGQE